MSYHNDPDLCIYEVYVDIRYTCNSKKFGEPMHIFELWPVVGNGVVLRLLYLERENGTQSRKWEGTPKNRPAAAVQRDTPQPFSPASDAGSAHHLRICKRTCPLLCSCLCPGCGHFQRRRRDGYLTTFSQLLMVNKSFFSSSFVLLLWPE